MHVVERSGELEVRDAPGLHWLLGLLFVGVGVLVMLGALGLARDAETLRSWERGLAVVMGGAAVVVGVWILERSPLSRLRVDGGARRLEIVRRGLRGRRALEISAAEVTGVRLVESTDDEGGAVFQVHLVLRHGGAVPVSLLWAHGRAPVTDVATRLAAALGVPYTPRP